MKCNVLIRGDRLTRRQTTDLVMEAPPGFTKTVCNDTKHSAIDALKLARDREQSLLPLDQASSDDDDDDDDDDDTIRYDR